MSIEDLAVRLFWELKWALRQLPATTRRVPRPTRAMPGVDRRCPQPPARQLAPLPVQALPRRGCNCAEATLPCRSPRLGVNRFAFLGSPYYKFWFYVKPKLIPCQFIHHSACGRLGHSLPRLGQLPRWQGLRGPGGRGVRREAATQIVVPCGRTGRPPIHFPPQVTPFSPLRFRFP